MNTLAEIVRADMVSSANRWGAAVESAERDGDSAAKARWEDQAEECALCYEAAIEAIEAGDLGRAESELEVANDMEARSGDNADAHHALQAVRAAAKPTSRMAYVSDETSRVVRIVGDVADGSAHEAELARTAPAGTSLVALECDATVGDVVAVDERGVAV